jgi:hypothetical protein
MPIVIPSGSTPAAAMESLVLDGLALNDESIFVLRRRSSSTPRRSVSAGSRVRTPTAPHC